MPRRSKYGMFGGGFPFDDLYGDMYGDFDGGYDDGRPNYSSMAEKSGAAKRREQDAKDAFNGIRATVEADISRHGVAVCNYGVTELLIQHISSRERSLSRLSFEVSVVCPWSRCCCVKCASCVATTCDHITTTVIEDLLHDTNAGIIRETYMFLSSSQKC